MIHLMGLTVRDEQHPEGDIEIAYTGLRPAEKLYEELLIGNNVTGTQHPMILRAIEHSLPWERIQWMLDEIQGAMARFDCQRALAAAERRGGRVQAGAPVARPGLGPARRANVGRSQGHQLESPPCRSKYHAHQYRSDGYRPSLRAHPFN